MGIELLATDGRTLTRAQLPRGNKAQLARAIKSFHRANSGNLAGASPASLLQSMYVHLKTEPIASFTSSKLGMEILS